MAIVNRLCFTLFTASLVAAATANINSPTTPAADPIAPLNECIQRRFQDRKVFGMTRVLPQRAHGIRRFQPENATELNVLTELRNDGYQVALFLVGRYALDVPPVVGGSDRFGLQGPAFMTAEPKDLPDSKDLLAEGRRALVGFDARDGYDLRRGEWVVAMRPVRASNAACVQCHTVGRASMIRAESHRPKLGDALGAAIYVYRRR